MQFSKVDVNVLIRGKSGIFVKRGRLIIGLSAVEMIKMSN